ncbi:colorectal mutant cancer protein [Cheilinus undulatus]|uniref:colorectal mutant cancer protein n=1 Tax=Cheilinus undulatus TaxID=241271 RepID=UPI001BD60A02|nr:colorectal mutant cancer protein [Cheilinus undulatus]
MEDPGLVRCDSLDNGTGSDWEGMTLMDHMTLDPEGSEPAANLEPSPAELAQCEAEVGTLLSIIAELNKKMGSLKAPSESGDLRPAGPPGPLVPDLLSHRLARNTPERTMASASKPPLSGRGGGGVVWTKLQDVLSSLETSISCKRSWAAPITALDQDKHREHLRAAQESWVKSSQILEDMEKEFGISCPAGPPKDQNQENVLDVEMRDSAHRGSLQGHQEELQRAQSSIGQIEEERNKLVGLQKSWRSGSVSPSYRPPIGPLSPDWASPPFPGSPLLSRRSSRAVTPLPLSGDGSPLGSIHSCSPCPSPISPESETERLSRCIERLKARNERLTAALERRKAESEQMSIKVNRLEADCCALQTALRYSEDCEEAYSELLSIYDSKKQQSIPDSAEKVSDRQHPDSPSAQLRKMGTEELSTSFSTAGGTEETQTQRHMGQRTPEQVEKEAALRQKIERLKRDRAAICPPIPSKRDEGKMNPETANLAGSRREAVTKESLKPPDTKKEKASLFYELISVREEMSDLRALIRLKEKELRCLEWSLMAQKAQEAAGAFVPESLREELEDRTTEQQRLCDNAANLSGEGDTAGPRSRPILKELQAVLQREQALKKRLALVQDSLNTALSDSSSHRRDNGEQFARLTQAHSKALSSYRQIRRKYREQVWRLEQKVAAMMESHQQQSGAQKAAGEASEWRREETIL